MSDRDPPRKPPSTPPPPDASKASPREEAPHNSGRVQFDERGQAIWAWAVKTGMFDRNASTQRIRKLVETPIELQLEDSPSGVVPPGTAAGTPHGAATGPAGSRPPAPRTAGPTTPARPGTSPDPRSTRTAPPTERPAARGPASPPLKPGESAGFDPYSSGPAKTPERTSYNPYERGSKKR